VRSLSVGNWGNTPISVIWATIAFLRDCCVWRTEAVGGSEYEINTSALTKAKEYGFVDLFLCPSDLMVKTYLDQVFMWKKLIHHN